MTSDYQNTSSKEGFAAKHSLARYLFTVSSLMVLVSVIMIALVWAWFEISYFTSWSQRTLKNEMHTVQEMLIKETRKAKDYINGMIVSADSLMRIDLQHRVREAHDIASHLELFYRDVLPEDEIKRLIIEALRPIRFNDGLGFYFIIDADEVYQLYPTHVYSEGLSLRSIQGELGSHIISSMLINTRQYGEVYHNYRWLRRQGDTHYYDKTAALIHFKPFDWVIGTSGYNEDFLEKLQAEALSNLEKMRFGGDGSIFAGQLDGISLGGATKGQDLSELTDENGVPIIKELIAAAQKGGAFVRYVVPPLTVMEPRAKLSYVESVEKWKWYLGAGIYIYQIEDQIAAKRLEMKERLNRQFFLLALVLVLTIAIAMAIGYYYRGKLEKSVAAFTNDYLLAAHLEKEQFIKSEKYDFLEFQQLAEMANRTFQKLKTLQKNEQESKIRYQAMFENAGDAILVIQGGRFIECNPRALQIFKAFPEEILGKRPDELSPQEQPDGEKSREKAEKIIQKALNGERQIFEWMHRRSGGSNFQAEVILNDYSIGNEKYIITILRDISERKQVEMELAKYRSHLEERIHQRSQELKEAREELIRHEKLAILGRLTATVAHEIRNPLGTIRTALFAVNDIIGTTDEKRLQRASILAERNIRRIDNIIEELLDYSKKRIIVRKKTNMDKWLRNLIEEFDFAENIIVQTELITGAYCCIDGEYFRRALINLLQNAQQAMAEAAAKGNILSIISQADEREYQLIIRDSGTGISPDIMEKLFTPLFSTKSYGIGLGLAIVKDIILDHHGQISFQNHPLGAEALIILPTAISSPGESSDKPAEDRLDREEK